MGFRRRFRFAIAVLVAQVLLLGISVGWCLYLGLILNNGEGCFEEPNSTILYAEIIGLAVIIIYSITVFALQWKRLGERRSSDRHSSSASGRRSTAR